MRRSERWRETGSCRAVPTRRWFCVFLLSEDYFLIITFNFSQKYSPEKLELICSVNSLKTFHFLISKHREVQAAFYNGILCDVRAVRYLRLSLLPQTPPSHGWLWLWWLRPASWRLFLSSSTSSSSPKGRENWITSWPDRAAHSNEATAWDGLWYAPQNRRSWWSSLVVRLLFNTPLKWIHGFVPSDDLIGFFFFLPLSLKLEMKCFIDCC